MSVCCTSSHLSALTSTPFTDEANLTEELGVPIQLVVVNTAPADLVHRILVQGGSCWIKLCLQAVQDVASHIVADARLGDPSTNQQLFRLLEGAGWIDAKLADSLRAAIGFRNVLVHG